MIKIIKPLINQFMPFAQKRMGFDKPPRLFLRSDVSNADNPLGKTAYYDPNEQKVVLYITGRHPKDVMRSLSHELVHHTQNLRGDFDNVQAMGDGYAQNDAHLREMEREAYEMGNLCFRDWEDSIKHTIYFEHLQKGVATIMSTKDWKNKEIQGLLSEAWGFKMNLDNLTEAKGREPENEEEEKFAALAPPEKLITHADTIAGATEDDKKKKNEAKHEDEDKENMDEGGCPSMDREGETAMMVVGDEPDMMGSEMGVEAKLDMILDKLSALMGGDMMEEQKIREAVRKALKVSTNMVSEGEDENPEDIMAISDFIENHPNWETYKNVMSKRSFRRGMPSVIDTYNLAGHFYKKYGKDWKQHKQDIITALMRELDEDRKLREAVRKALKASIKKA